MDLELSDDQQELRDNIRQVLEGACGPDVVRAVYEHRGDHEALWEQMVELYWPAIGVGEDTGGLGLTFVEVGLLAEELGRAAAPGPLLATVTQFVPIIDELASLGERATLLAAVAEGRAAGCLAFAERGRWNVDAVTATASHDGDGWRLTGTKDSVLGGAHADEVAIVARTPQGVGVFVVPAADVTITAREAFEPTLGLADIVFDGVFVDPARAVADAEVSVARASEAATIAMALCGVGASRRIFEVTLDYLKVREQYDRIIGSFQALKHRMAELFLAVERANAMCYFAALTVAEDDPRRTEAAHLAKAAAGDCQRLLAEDGLQLHGGIGYTWENDLHFLLKRAKAADLLCGTATTHRAALAPLIGLGACEETVAGVGVGGSGGASEETVAGVGVGGSGGASEEPA